MDKLLELIKILAVNRFYGKLVISFEAGRVAHLKKEESIKV